MKTDKGFTLIELVIVIALIGVILSTTFSFISFSFRNIRMQNEKTNIISNARTTMDYLTREIRKSDLIEINDNIITMESNVYRLEDRILFKNNKKVIEGIDELNIVANSTINIEIVIKDSRGKDYTFSSDVSIR